MTNEPVPTHIKELTERVERIKEQKRLEANATEAVRRARELIQARREFIPKQINPLQPVRVRF